MELCPHCLAVIPEVNDFVVVCGCEGAVQEEREFRQRNKNLARTLVEAREEQRISRQKKRRLRNATKL